MFFSPLGSQGGSLGSQGGLPLGSQGASRPMGLKDPGPGAQGLKADGPQGPGAGAEPRGRLASGGFC